MRGIDVPSGHRMRLISMTEGSDHRYGVVVDFLRWHFDEEANLSPVSYVRPTIMNRTGVACNRKKEVQ